MNQYLRDRCNLATGDTQGMLAAAQAEIGNLGDVADWYEGDDESDVSFSRVEQMLWVVDAELEDEYDFCRKGARIFWGQEFPSNAWGEVADCLQRQLEALPLPRKDVLIVLPSTPPIFGQKLQNRYTQNPTDKPPTASINQLQQPSRDHEFHRHRRLSVVCRRSAARRL